MVGSDSDKFADLANMPPIVSSGAVLFKDEPKGQKDQKQKK